MKEQKMIDELNQTGPVTEEVFEADRTIHNLKEFMRKERYTEEEIEANHNIRKYFDNIGYIL